MQTDAKYKAVKQSRCMTRVITALRSPRVIAQLSHGGSES